MNLIISIDEIEVTNTMLAISIIKLKVTLMSILEFDKMSDKM
jgi:hypothetical protein